MYDEDVMQDWELLSKKSVPDSDGFLTEYSLYRSTDGSMFICMFGDSDIYEPDPNYADYETDDEDTAWEWFNNYTGFADDEDDDIFSAEEDFALDFDKLTSKNWAGMVSQLSEHGLEVDSAYKRSPDKHIIAYHGSQAYQIEVTQYFRGDYEILADNIYLYDEDAEHDSAPTSTFADELNSLYESVQKIMDTIGELEDAYFGDDDVTVLYPVYNKLESAWKMLGKAKQ